MARITLTKSNTTLSLKYINTTFGPIPVVVFNYNGSISEGDYIYRNGGWDSSDSYTVSDILSLFSGKIDIWMYRTQSENDTFRIYSSMSGYALTSSEKFKTPWASHNGFNFCSMTSDDSYDIYVYRTSFQSYLENNQNDTTLSGTLFNPGFTTTLTSPTYTTCPCFWTLYSTIDNKYISFKLYSYGSDTGYSDYIYPLHILEALLWSYGSTTSSLYSDIWSTSGSEPSEGVPSTWSVNDTYIQEQTSVINIFTNSERLDLYFGSKIDGDEISDTPEYNEPQPGTQDTPYKNSTKPTSHYGGGTGSFDYSSDTISTPTAPDISYNSLGVCGVWCPTSEQLQSIMSSVWSGSVLTALRDIFGNNNIFDAFVSLKKMPFTVSSSGTAELALGTVKTNVTVNICSSQFVTLTYTGECPHFTGDFYDYDPYVGVDIHLPFIGIVSLDTNIVMGQTLTVQYIIDVTSGYFLTSVICNHSVVNTYQGECGYSIPITGLDMRNSNRSMATMMLSTMMSVSSMNTSPLGLVGQEAGALGSMIQAGGGNIRKSGGIGGTPGTFDTYDVYLLIKCPDVSYISRSNPDIHGYRSSGVAFLSNLKGEGFTQIDLINPSITGASQREVEELNSMLRGGVIL